MARFKQVDGIKVQLTTQEEADFDAATQAGIAAKPLQVWHDDMVKTDSQMPRTMEDILDGMPNKLGVAQFTLDILQAKKDKRSEKP